MPEEFEVEKAPQIFKTCPAVGSQSAELCLPIKIVPFASTRPAKLMCCGEADVIPYCDSCPGKKDGSCEFTITQKIRVEIPVEFGASVHIGDTYVHCGCEKGDLFDEECDCD